MSITFETVRTTDDVTVISHNDNDGKFAAAVVRYAYPDAKIYTTTYGRDIDLDFCLESRVFVLDFSLPIEVMRELDAKYDLVWIDHHPVINIYKQAGFDPDGLRATEHSAAYLTWQYLFPDKAVPLVLKYVSDYDIWTHKYPESLLFNYGSSLCYLNPCSYRSADNFAELFERDEDVAVVARNGAKIKDYVNLRNKCTRHECAFESVLDGHKAIACHACGVNSLLFYDENGELDARFKEYDPAVLIVYSFNTDTAQWRVSLYSPKNSAVDVGVLATKYGGGGHPGAAGFLCDELPFATPPQGDNPPVAIDHYAGVIDLQHNDQLIRGYIDGATYVANRYHDTIYPPNGKSWCVVNGTILPDEVFYYERDKAMAATIAPVGVFSSMTASGWYRQKIYILAPYETTNEEFVALYGGTIMPDGTIIRYARTFLE